MYAGHFAPITILQKMYPEVSPFVFTIGVGFLDITFGLLSYYGFEGFFKNPESGSMGVDIHCNYSHSLIGSIILSLIYGIVTGTFIPGFLASFSHFICDWLVHNKDLPLDPYTNIMIGGTELWSSYPILSYYFEMIFCIIFALFSKKDISTISANIFILLLHLSMHSITPKIFSKILNLPELYKRRYTAIVMISSFVIPAIVIGLILNRKNKNKYKQN